MAVPVHVVLVVGRQLARPVLPRSGSVSPFHSGFFGRCPRCGDGALFDGFLDVADRCTACGLDCSGQNSGDGAAFFIIMCVGFIVVGLALMLEVMFAPPVWLHMVLWLPLILVLTLAMMRPAKGILIALQYRHGVDFESDRDSS